MEEFSRTELILGARNMEKLHNSKVLLFGVGGVGGYVAEALARSGVGEISLVDKDVVSASNINRQIIATHDTIGMPKVEVMKNRILSINPECKVYVYNEFYLPNSNTFDFSKYDYIVDAIDTVSAKIDIVEKAYAANTKVISAMGAGNKLDPSKLVVTDINKTSVCPLARVMRYELRKRNIKKLKVVYSTEEPIELDNKLFDEESGKAIPGSTAFVPSVAGLLLAREVVLDLIKE